jgi:hypothetical protein
VSRAGGPRTELSTVQLPENISFHDIGHDRDARSAPIT